MMARNKMRLARYTAAQAKQQIMNELDNDTDACSDDSGTDYQDHISEFSEDESA